MLMSFYIKFIRLDKKQRRNGEACRASPTCFWSSLINLISKDTNMVFLFITHHKKTLMSTETKRNEKQQHSKFVPTS